MIRFFPLFACVIFFAQVAEPPAPASLPIDLGVNIHFTDPRPGEMEMIAAGGFKWVRMDFSWGGIERKKGEYDFTHYDTLAAALEQRGMKAIFILDYGNGLYDAGRSPATDEAREAFAKWAAASVSHFKRRGFLWEMWNEPNGRQFWKPTPNVENYAKLALAVGKAVRDAEPNEQYIGPGTSGVDLKFIAACCKAGCLEYWSAVSVHPYRQTNPESAALDYRKLRMLIAQYAPKEKRIPIISSEWGFSAGWQNFDEEKQGKYLPREILTNLWQEIPVSIWYDWHDDGLGPKEPEHHFGTVHNPYRKDNAEVYEPKAAYKAMKALAEQLNGYQYNKRLKVESPDDFVLLFSRGEQSQEVMIVAWTTGTEHEITLPGIEGEFKAFTYLGTADEDASGGARGLAIELTDTPLYLSPRTPNATLQMLARWSRVPLEVITRGPREVSLSTSAWTGMGKGETPAFHQEYKAQKVGRSPEGIPMDFPFPAKGMEAFEQQTMVFANNPLRVTLLPRAPDALPIRIEDPAGGELTGQVTLIGTEGLEIEQTSRPFALKPGQTETVVRFPIKPDGPDYSFGVQVTDAQDRLLIETPHINYMVMPDLAAGAVDGKTNAYKLFTDGDAKVASEQSLSLTAPPEAAPEPGLGVMRVQFKTAAGWKFWRIAPVKDELKTIPGRPTALGLWICGDGGGERPRLRFIDSTGQTFQPAAEPIDWKGWQYVTFPMQADKIGNSHWGGANDGYIHYPIHWDTIFLLDRDAKQPADGTVYIAGPTLVR